MVALAEEDTTAAMTVKNEITVAPDGKCTEQDLQIWIDEGAEDKRPELSNYCSREWNGGCFLDADCIKQCFQENYGYSEECSGCFGAIPTCSIASGCLMAW